MALRAPADARVKNADVPWGAFDPIAYVDHNYRKLQDEDAEILRTVRDHFAGHFRNPADGPILGIDVGAGANLYPALSMLPWCDEITLFERSPANVGYLRGQIGSYDRHWDQFWDALRANDAYGNVSWDPRERFAGTVRVEQGDLFDLERHQGRWSVGTMFFVAESMTGSRAEFFLGVERFMRALAPGAPFAAAFMEHSRGYHAGDYFFPACDVGESDVYESLAPYARDFKAHRLTASAGVREGYSAMILAYGWRNSEPVLPVH
ncbi:SCO2525 family SAM-dependent methyltransferase [Streptomyces sp. MS06]|uniref:SCO2525 family SAM-dependent methyltransferase n=1 Tax=Streptomyces sp. MS06 TaxID=3385974 RepID=UPI0039A36AC2